MRKADILVRKAEPFPADGADAQNVFVLVALGQGLFLFLCVDGNDDNMVAHVLKNLSMLQDDGDNSALCGKIRISKKRDVHSIIV